MTETFSKQCILKVKIHFVFFIILLFSTLSLNAQIKYKITHDDSLALENVIVEKYYISDSTDCVDTTGGLLAKGSTTYRIYIDMKPGYSLQLVYGNKKHELLIKTSTTFFNNEYCSALTGFNISYKEINENTVALDSWITMGAATKLHAGILLADDTDGSILKRASLAKADGLTKGTSPTLKIFNLDLNCFRNTKNASLLSTKNGGWAALGGVKGPTPDNRVLIAQLTTNGILSFELNIQIGTPTGGYVKFVARDPEGSELQFKGLTHN